MISQLPLVTREPPWSQGSKDSTDEVHANSRKDSTDEVDENSRKTISLDDDGVSCAGTISYSLGEPLNQGTVVRSDGVKFMASIDEFIQSARIDESKLVHSLVTFVLQEKWATKIKIVQREQHEKLSH